MILYLQLVILVVLYLQLFILQLYIFLPCSKFLKLDFDDTHCGGFFVEVEEAMQSSKIEYCRRWRRGRWEQCRNKCGGRWCWSMKMVIEGESYGGMIIVKEMWWKLQREFWELFQIKNLSSTQKPKKSPHWKLETLIYNLIK